VQCGGAQHSRRILLVLVEPQARSQALHKVELLVRECRELQEALLPRPPKAQQEGLLLELLEELQPLEQEQCQEARKSLEQEQCLAVRRYLEEMLSRAFQTPLHQQS